MTTFRVPDKELHLRCLRCTLGLDGTVKVMKAGQMRSITASEFKAKCLQLMDEVSESGEPLVITKRGRPVAELRPAAKPRKSLYGLHAGQIEILGDIISPLDEPWEAYED